MTAHKDTRGCIGSFVPTPNKTHEVPNTIAMGKNNRNSYGAEIGKLLTSPWVRGFTLVELIVVIGITVLISSILIGFSSQSRSSLLLSAEQVKAAQIILRAKTRALSAYGNASASPLYPAVCGFGVHFDPAAESYEMFQWNERTKADCKTMSASVSDPINTLNPRYVPIDVSNAVPSSFTLGSGAGTISDVFFVPPRPKTDVWVTGGGLSPNGIVQLSTKDGAQTLAVTVTDAGQVSP